jgi:hypothetical protein
MRCFGPSHLKPSIFIVGAQKAGTTMLQGLVAKNPSIKPPKEKEIAFFTRSYSYDQGVEHYLKQFPKRRLFRQFKTFDATPNYLSSPECAGRIHALFPKAKILIVLRDPVDRAYSAWNMYRRMVREKTPIFMERQEHAEPAVKAYWQPYLSRGEWISFEECVDAELNDQAPVRPDCVRRGLYADQVQRYLDWFGPAQVHLMRFSDLKNNTEALLNDVFSFLGLDPMAFPEENRQRMNKGRYDSGISPELQKRLEAYYESSNRKVFDLTGWSGY